MGSGNDDGCGVTTEAARDGGDSGDSGDSGDCGDC